MQRICVFCGSSDGARASYLDAARETGRLFAERGIGLVYGGGRTGLMGAIADAAVESGGEVIGIIPHSLSVREVAHTGLSDLRVVDSMHERKALMAELSDAFISLPGGMGTLEETCEMITWAQLGIHQKPCGVLNVDGYFDALFAFLDHSVQEGFIRRVHRRLVVEGATPRELLEKMEAFAPPELERWITRSET